MKLHVTEQPSISKEAQELIDYLLKAANVYAFKGTMRLEDADYAEQEYYEAQSCLHDFIAKLEQR